MRAPLSIVTGVTGGAVAIKRRHMGAEYYNDVAGRHGETFRTAVKCLRSAIKACMCDGTAISIFADEWQRRGAAWRRDGCSERLRPMGYHLRSRLYPAGTVAHDIQYLANFRFLSLFTPCLF